MNGEGVTKDKQKSIDLYQRASDLGNMDAMADIGNMYLFGDGVEQDYTKAAEYYQPAAEAELARRNDLRDVLVAGDAQLLLEPVEVEQYEAARLLRPAVPQREVYVSVELAPVVEAGELVLRNVEPYRGKVDVGGEEGDGKADDGHPEIDDLEQYVLSL